MSINASGGDRIKISPTTSGVSALPPNVSLFYEITESLYNVGDTLPLSSLISLIQEASEGATIDLQNKTYVADGTWAQYAANNAACNVSKSLTISNGTISGATPLSWSLDPGSSVIYRAPIDNDEGAYADVRCYLIDPNATEMPLYSQSYTIDDTEIGFTYRFTDNEEWYRIDNTMISGVSVEQILVEVDGNETVWTSTTGDHPIIGMILGTAEKTNFETYAATCGGASNVTLFVHSDANLVETRRIISYNSTTGKIIFRTPATAQAEDSFKFKTYADFNYSGTRTGLEEGEFNVAYDGSQRYVYYRPVNGNAQDARMPIVNRALFRISTGDTLTFNNVTINGHINGVDGTPSVFSSATIPQTQTAPSFVLNGCNISYCGNAFAGSLVTSYDTIYKRFSDRICSIKDGSIFERNIIQDSENRSAILLQSSTPDQALFDAGITEPRESIFRDNVFYLPATAHGNALALYKSTWMNATVEHNIFASCKNAIVFQAGASTWNVPWTGDETEPEYWLTIRENLMVYYLDSTGVTGLQSGFTWNSGTLIEWDSDTQPGPRVLIENNTCWWNLSEIDPNATASVTKATRGMWLGLTGFACPGDGDGNNSDTSAYTTGPDQYVHIRGNYLPGMSSVDRSDAGDSDDGRVFSQGNFYSLTQADASSKYITKSSGATDTNAVEVGDPVVLYSQHDSTFDVDTFQVSGAADGTGVNWTTIPTQDQVEAIVSNGTTGWGTIYPMGTSPTYPVPGVDDGPLAEGEIIT